MGGSASADHAICPQLLDVIVSQAEHILQHCCGVLAETGPAPGPPLRRAPGQPDWIANDEYRRPSERPRYFQQHVAVSKVVVGHHVIGGVTRSGRDTGVS